MVFRILALALLLASTAVFADDRPACDASTSGLFWPEAANHDSKLRNQFSRCGDLEICARGRWRFHWKSLTVRLDQLRGGSQMPKPSGCEVLPDTGRDESHVPAPDGRTAPQR
ncbi:MAG TPA: hypothetical protein VKT81_10690 [Bryobacteraceae bacterium]|nr:hypothetical protein [Bryobacteraceae bacterium]